MEACIQRSREIILEGRLIHITLEVIARICTIVTTAIKLINIIVKAIAKIADRVSSNQKKK